MITLSSLLATVADADASANPVYQAAVSAAQVSLDEAVAALDVESTKDDIGSPGEMGGMLFANYSIGLRVAGREIKLNGWALCGWLARGASADLDGSGLANWGSSQPGGWTQCETAGQVSGLPRVEVDEDQCALIFHHGYGRGTDIVLPVAELLGLSPADTAIVAEHLHVPRALMDRIEALLVSPAIPAPTAEEIWDDLDGRVSTLEPGESIRVGRYQRLADYVFVVTCRGGEYEANQAGDDWESAVETAATDAVRTALDRLSQPSWD